MKEISSVIEIDASAEEVWGILTDFNQFSQWNPLIRNFIVSSLKEGEKLEISLKYPGASKSTKLFTKINHFKPNSEFGWTEKILVGGLVESTRKIRVVPLKENTCRVYQGETMKGVFSSMVSNDALAQRKKAFDNMNRALKKRAETNS